MSDFDEAPGWSIAERIEEFNGVPPGDQTVWLRSLMMANPPAAMAAFFPKAEDSNTAHAAYFKLHDMLASHHARELFEELVGGPSVDVAARLVDGGSFIHDLPPDIPTVWGHGTSVVWAEGEALTITGPPGVGKTTLAGQIVRGRLLGGKVLGMPVSQTSSRVLYLAMDRPQQIARAMARMLAEVPRDTLAKHLSIWPGPPPQDMAAHPESLLELARQVGADTVVLDSLKDAALKLTEDEGGAGYNRARQLCLANGVEIMELHHTVKKGDNGGAPTQLQHVYGSAWITAGSGSVVSLFGQPGDPIVQWRHLKQPAEEVGPFKVAHDHDAGTSRIWDQADLSAMARGAGRTGITAKDAAQAMFDSVKPTEAEVQKARRKLDSLVRAGRLERHAGDDATHRATVWTDSSDPEEDFRNLI